MLPPCASKSSSDGLRPMKRCDSGHERESRPLSEGSDALQVHLMKRPAWSREPLCRHPVSGLQSVPWQQLQGTSSAGHGAPWVPVKLSTTWDSKQLPAATDVDHVRRATARYKTPTRTCVCTCPNSTRPWQSDWESCMAGRQPYCSPPELAGVSHP
jgi:hypothetical protein